MPSNLIKLPMPSGYYYASAWPLVMGLIWLHQGFPILGAGLVALTPLLLLVGQKFELEPARQRYRVGLHWAHLLNPAWEHLPPVQGVVLKPYAYRQLQRRKYGDGLADAGVWKGYTVLLSVPGAQRGVVVASVTSAAQAEEIATEVAGALEVSWQRV